MATITQNTVSIRTTQEIKDDFNELSKDFDSKSDAFMKLIKTYKESKGDADLDGAIYLQYISDLCENLRMAFRNILTSKQIALENQENIHGSVIKDLEDHKKKLENARIVENNLRQELDKAVSDRDSLQRTYDNLKDALEGKWKVEVEAEKREKIDIQNQLAEALKSSQTLQNQLETAQAGQKSDDMAITALKGEIEALKGQNEVLVSENILLKEKIQNFESKITEFEKRASRSKARTKKVTPGKEDQDSV